MSVNCVQVTPECPVQDSTYGYYPSLGANAFFVAFYVLFFGINLALGLSFKTWTYSLLICMACITETIGYIGRILMHYNPYSYNGFIMQICCIIMGPAWNSGAIYLTLKYVALTFGEQWSRVKPWTYTWIFISGDFLALVLQAIGGAMASTADTTTQSGLQQMTDGNHIAMAGICWQVFTLLVFGVATSDYVIRRNRDLSSTPLSPAASATIHQTKFRVFAGAISIAWLTIFTRCVYRIIEFAAGWGNPIMQDQATFIALEGVMVVLATFCQTMAHPGYCFPIMSFRKPTSPANVEEPKVMSGSDSSREVVAAEPKSVV